MQPISPKKQNHHPSSHENIENKSERYLLFKKIKAFGNNILSFLSSCLEKFQFLKIDKNITIKEDKNKVNQKIENLFSQTKMRQPSEEKSQTNFNPLKDLKSVFSGSQINDRATLKLLERRLNYEEDLQRVKDANSWYPWCLSEINLLSLDIEDWLASTQDVEKLNQLIKRTDSALQFYLESIHKKEYSKKAPPYAIAGRLDALLSQAHLLRSWFETRQANNKIQQRPVKTLEKQCEELQEKYRISGLEEDHYSSLNYFQTHAVEDCLDTTKGTLNLEGLPKQNQINIKTFFDVIGLSGNNWKKWLLDDCMSVIFTILAKNTSTRHDVVTSITTNDKIADKLLDTLKKHPNSRIGTAVNMGGNHWTLVFLDPHTKTIEWYDSLAGYNKSVKQQLTRIQQELHDRNGLDFTIINKIPHAVQKDGYQCGAWVGYFFEQRLLLDDFSVDMIEQPYNQVPDEFRKRMHNEVLAPRLWEYISELKYPLHAANMQTWIKAKK